MRIRVPLATAAVLCCAWSGAAEAKKTTLDAGLYATYSGGPTSIGFIVCGSVPGSSGCYGSGSLGPFEQACAVLEGTATQKDDVVTRAIYVLDKRTSKTAPITLTVFKRTDTIADGFDQILVTQVQQIPLGVNGGAKSHCSMAANDAFVYAATDADTVAVGVDKKSFATFQLGGFSPPETVTSITADERGYVSLHFDGGFYIYAPDGSFEGDGGGSADMVGTRSAWKP
jgi:hypothetical protein